MNPRAGLRRTTRVELAEICGEIANFVEEVVVCDMGTDMDQAGGDIDGVDDGRAHLRTSSIPCSRLVHDDRMKIQTLFERSEDWRGTFVFVLAFFKT